MEISEVNPVSPPELPSVDLPQEEEPVRSEELPPAEDPSIGKNIDVFA